MQHWPALLEFHISEVVCFSLQLLPWEPGHEVCQCCLRGSLADCLADCLARHFPEAPSLMERLREMSKVGNPTPASYKLVHLYKFLLSLSVSLSTSVPS